MLPDNSGHLVKVEESFHFCPDLLGILENPRHQKKLLGNLGIFMMPDNFELIIRVQNSFCCYPPPLQVLSHM
jgi:hypothetical protein